MTTDEAKADIARIKAQATSRLERMLAKEMRYERSKHKAKVRKGRAKVGAANQAARKAKGAKA